MPTVEQETTPLEEQAGQEAAVADQEALPSNYDPGRRTISKAAALVVGTTSIAALPVVGPIAIKGAKRLLGRDQHSAAPTPPMTAMETQTARKPRRVELVSAEYPRPQTKEEYLAEAYKQLNNTEFLRQQGFYAYTNSDGERIIFATGQDDLQPDKLAKIAEKLAKEQAEQFELEPLTFAPVKGEKLQQVEKLPLEMQLAILAALDRARDSGISASLESIRVFGGPVHRGGEIRYHTTTGIGPPNPQALADDFYPYSPLSPWTQMASHFDSYTDNQTGAIQTKFVRDNYTQPADPDFSFNRIRREAPEPQGNNGESYLYLDEWTPIQEDYHVTPPDETDPLPYRTRLCGYRMTVNPKTGSASVPVEMKFAYLEVENYHYGRLDYTTVVNDFGPGATPNLDLFPQPPTPA